jgi:hypothetical protein
MEVDVELRRQVLCNEVVDIVQGVLPGSLSGPKW